MSFYEFSCSDAGGQMVSMGDYAGQVLLVVNVASECGFTQQYEALEVIYQRYKDRGFSVLAFPSNQFGGQEPGDNAQILNFCRSKFKVSFPVFAKLDVNGEDADPLFSFLKQEARGLMHTRAIKWNFTKFLLNRSGSVVKRFSPATSPEDLSGIIESLL
jgi:glutathione peroxidase